jgi:hypothetical protein
MQQRIRSHRTLDYRLIYGTVVLVAMVLQRDLAEVALQARNLRLPVSGDAANRGGRAA